MMELADKDILKAIYSKQLHTEWMDKVLPYSTGNCIQCPEIYHNGKDYKKECVTESLCCTAKLTQHCKSIILQ